MDTQTMPRGRAGGLALAAKSTPEQRKARGRRAYLAGAVRTVAARVEELTQEERDALRAALCA